MENCQLNEHTYMKPLQGSQPCLGEEAFETNEAMSCAIQGHPIWMGHSGEF